LPAGSGEKDHVVLVSTHIPKCLQGIVSLKKVGSHLAVNKLPRKDDYPFTNATLMALPLVD